MGTSPVPWVVSTRTTTSTRITTTTNGNNNNNNNNNNHNNKTTTSTSQPNLQLLGDFLRDSLRVLEGVDQVHVVEQGSRRLRQQPKDLVLQVCNLLLAGGNLIYVYAPPENTRQEKTCSMMERIQATASNAKPIRLLEA